MKAPNLINGAAFDPEALKVVGQAFEASWAEIADSYGDDAATIEQARVTLAHAILAIAFHNATDFVLLNGAALQLIAAGFLPPANDRLPLDRSPMSRMN